MSDATDSVSTGAPPWAFALIVLQQGAYQGFVTITFAFIATQHGMSVAAVAAVAGIVGLTLSASALKVLWTPAVDLFLSLKQWIVLGTVLTAAALVALVTVPFTPHYTVWLGLVALLGACASTTAAAAGGGLLVLAIDRRRLGAASGFWQGGALVAQGIGGGAGLWLATHFGVLVAAMIVAAACLASLAALAFVVEPPRPHLTETLPGRLRAIGLDLWETARSRRGLFVTILMGTPIGVGGASYLWSAIAGEWQAGAQTVALVTGFASAFASAVGAFLFGRYADRYDRVQAFFFTGLLLVGAAALLAVLPRTPTIFVAGTLTYALLLGFSYTSFSALVFETIGGGAAASKNVVLNAIGNFGVAYMPPFFGWVHDRSSTTTMLWSEVVVTLAVIGVAALADRFVVRAPMPGAIPAPA